MTLTPRPSLSPLNSQPCHSHSPRRILAPERRAASVMPMCPRRHCGNVSQATCTVFATVTPSGRSLLWSPNEGGATTPRGYGSMSPIPGHRHHGHTHIRCPPVQIASVLARSRPSRPAWQETAHGFVRGFFFSKASSNPNLTAETQGVSALLLRPRISCVRAPWGQWRCCRSTSQARWRDGSK